MAILATIMTQHGEERECYIRLNNVEASNHGTKGVALFRAFLSRQAYEEGAQFVGEYRTTFDADVSAPLWPQAYAALKDHIPFPQAEANERDRGEEELGRDHGRQLAANAAFAVGMRDAQMV